MTKDEELQQALEKVADALPAYIDGVAAREYLAVIHNALAQEQEPEQWQKRHPLRTQGKWENTNEPDAKWWRDNAQGWDIRALFTAPPKRQPLTTEEIADIVIEMNGNEPTGLFWRDLARAIEAAHDIGEKT
jgi:hypothetical protein